MKVHDLKIEPIYFNAIKHGFKTHEIRKNDRDFKIGDLLLLTSTKQQESTLKTRSQQIFVRVNYIDFGGKYGIAPDYVVMSIEVVEIK